MNDVVVESNFGVIENKNDNELMQRVLAPYFEHTTYLKSAEVFANGDPSDEGKIIGKGRFEIPRSCYIDDTGHLNSVEVNICYNQLMYYMVATAVENKMMWVFKNWTLDEYFQKQLSDTLIINYSSIFKKPIHPKCFYGEVDFLEVSLKKSKSLALIKTSFRYGQDPHQFSCQGDVLLAIKNMDFDQ